MNIRSNIKKFWDARGNERFKYMHQSSNLENETSESIKKSKLELKNIFFEENMLLEYDEFMHNDDSEFNKWSNTRLNLMVFKLK